MKKRKPILQAPLTKTSSTPVTAVVVNPKVTFFDDGKLHAEPFKRTRKPKTVNVDRVLGTLIHVTQKDIADGRIAQSWNCPIALAITRELGAIEPSVGPRTADVNGVLFRLPYKARIFVKAFDTREPVKPFSFRLEGF